jgi:hypothetical protein
MSEAAMSTELEKLLWRLRARHAAWQKETGAKDGSIFLWAADALDAAQERERGLRKALTDFVRLGEDSPRDKKGDRAFIDVRDLEAFLSRARAALGDPNAST